MTYEEMETKMFELQGQVDLFTTLSIVLFLACAVLLIFTLELSHKKKEYESILLEMHRIINHEEGDIYNG